MKRFLFCAAMVLACLSVPAASAAPTPPAVVLSPRDALSIRAVMERYRITWLSNDADQVRSVFTPDAVIMPHHGLAPAVGMKAINDFWFPAGAAKTTILKYVRPIDEVGGDAALAYVRGRSEIAWKVEDKGKTENWKTSGSYLAVLMKQSDGQWRITHMIWDDLPNQHTD
jgi:uncharacterized protein (TIGR02246 family)